MSEKIFIISGNYMEKQVMKTFEKEVKAVNENFAKEKILSNIGSKHKINRYRITIENVLEKK